MTKFLLIADECIVCRIEKFRFEYNASSKAYFYNGTSGSNRAVTLVGGKYLQQLLHG